MAKKNKKHNTQHFLSEEQYLIQRARTLKIGKCYISNDIEKIGEGFIIVTRLHTGGKISAVFYLVDTYCLGVKDSFYEMRCTTDEVKEILSQYENMRECSYEEAHNMIYGAIEFAEEAGIEPHRSFRLTQYMLEEDTEDIPLIEYEFGKNGEHFLISEDYDELDRYFPTLKEHLGENFNYIVKDDGFDFPSEEEIAERLANLKDSPLFKRYGPSTEYTYKHPKYVDTLNLTTPEWFYKELNDESNQYGLSDEFIDRILQLPQDMLRENLERIIYYHIGQTCDGISDDYNDGKYTNIIGNSLVLLGEVGNADSLDVVLETMRQSSDFYDYHFGDMGNPFLVPTIYLLGQHSLDKFMDFVKEDGLYTFAKYHVFPAVTQIALRHKERYGEIVEWYREVVRFATKVLPETKWFDSDLAGLILHGLVDLQAKELLPDIKKMFDTGLVDLGACGDYKELCRIIKTPRFAGRISECIIDTRERFADMRRFVRQ